MKKPLSSISILIFLSLTACDSDPKGSSPLVSIPTGLRIHDTSLIEGDAGVSQMTFWVSLKEVGSTDVTFDYASIDGTAIAGVDYQSVTGAGVIPAGQLSTSFTVNIFGDAETSSTSPETDERFTVSLSNVSSNVVKVSLPSATGTIINDEGFTKYQAAVATVAPDYSSGAHSLIYLNGMNQFMAENNIAATHSDTTLAGDGQSIFRIERATGANVSKFDRNFNKTSFDWQYTAKDNGGTANKTNPQNLIVLNSSKAYLTRYGQSTVWIVNPSATSAAQFKIGELDLSAYADADASPEAHNGVIVGGKLFLTMQRIDFTPGWPNNVAGTAYVAVFDTATDTEIDTTGAGAAMKGIALTILNPRNDIVYNSVEHRIYVQGSGGFDGTKTGGVEKINPDAYTTSVVIQDSNPAYSHGKSEGIAIVSATQGYLIGSVSWGNHSLYKFNPSTGNVTGPVTGYVSKHLADISLDADNQLWISEAGAAATLHLLDTATDKLIGSVSTNLNPGQVVFFSP